MFRRRYLQMSKIILSHLYVWFASSVCSFIIPGTLSLQNSAADVWFFPCTLLYLQGALQMLLLQTREKGWSLKPMNDRNRRLFNNLAGERALTIFVFMLKGSDPQGSINPHSVELKSSVLIWWWFIRSLHFWQLPVKKKHRIRKEFAFASSPSLPGGAQYEEYRLWSSTRINLRSP